MDNDQEPQHGVAGPRWRITHAWDAERLPEALCSLDAAGYEPVHIVFANSGFIVSGRLRDIPKAEHQDS